MKNNPIPRLDENPDLRNTLLPHCRLSLGDIWEDPQTGHRIGCGDATDPSHIMRLTDNEKGSLAIQDPPYNQVAFGKTPVDDFIHWCESWVALTMQSLASDASFYIWLGADQKNHFQPLPQFMLMMSQIESLKSRSFITVRNQRGYGTQKNWMAIRQELLYYTIGSPDFQVNYTEIPKVLGGYYKTISGQKTENMERSKSKNIRPGNVWLDIQQVFYRMDENVSGCYAQKPLKSIDRIVEASSKEGDIVLDYFAHSGSTLLSCERLNRRCFTSDIDPIYCEIAIRRLERYRSSGKLGWQNSNPFESELGQIDVGTNDTSVPMPRLF